MLLIMTIPELREVLLSVCQDDYSDTAGSVDISQLYLSIDPFYKLLSSILEAV